LLFRRVCGGVWGAPEECGEARRSVERGRNAEGGERVEGAWGVRARLEGEVPESEAGRGS